MIEDGQGERSCDRLPTELLVRGTTAPPER
jgi:hypothetical protein